MLEIGVGAGLGLGTEFGSKLGFGIRVKVKFRLKRLTLQWPICTSLVRKVSIRPADVVAVASVEQARHRRESCGGMGGDVGCGGMG